MSKVTLGNNKNLEEEKKPSYIFWIFVLLNGIGVFFLTVSVLASLANQLAYPQSEAMVAAYFFIPSELIIFPIGLILILFSLFRKPRFYVRTIFVDAMFASVLIVLTWSSFQLIDGENGSFDLVLHEWRSYMVIIASVGVGILLNHIFGRINILLGLPRRPW